MSELHFCSACETLLRNFVTDPATQRLLGVCPNKSCKRRQAVSTKLFHSEDTVAKPVLPPGEIADDPTLVKVVNCYTCPNCGTSDARLTMIDSNMSLCAACTECTHVWYVNDRTGRRAR